MEFDSVEGINDFLPSFEANGQFLVFGVLGDFEAFVVGADASGEVILCGIENLVAR